MARLGKSTKKEWIRWSFFGAIVAFFGGGFIGVFGLGGAALVATVFLAAQIIVAIVEWLFVNDGEVPKRE